MSAGLPAVLTAETPGRVLGDVIPDLLPAVRDHLRRDGAVLLRDYQVGGVDGFDRVVRRVCGPPLSYAERSSPRSTIKGRIYTSTDYPANEEIFLHNENSYQQTWPRVLFFHCLREPTSLGATPLADVRTVRAAIDPAVRDEFVRRGWMVVRNFTAGFGVPWQQAFDTESRDEVAAYGERHGLEIEWVGRSGLRTRARRVAVHTHPETGEEVWFNHIAFFHVSTLSAEVAAGLRVMFDDIDLPTNTFYGDGAPIPDDVVEHLRSCYRGARRRFDWSHDDVLVVDNMLAAHGREPFTGPRRVAVAMAGPVSEEMRDEQPIR